MKLDREQMLRAYPEMPGQVRTRMDSTLLRLHTQGRRAPTRRLSLALAAVLVMLAATGAAAGAHFGVLDFLSERFGQNALPEARELVQTPEASLALANTSVSLEEAVYDYGRLRLVYSVKPNADIPVTETALMDEKSALYQAIERDGVSLTGGDWLRIDGEEIVMPGDSFADYAVDEEQGVVLCYVDIELGAWALAPQESFAVSLPVTLPASGSQTLDFTVTAKAISEPAMQLDAGAVRATVESFTPSPISTYVRLTLERAAGASDYDYENALADWQDAKLTDGKGHVLAEARDVMTVEETEGQSVTLRFAFPPVEASEIWFTPTAVTQDGVAPDMARAMGIKKGE